MSKLWGLKQGKGNKIGHFKQAISAHERVLCQLCVLSFRVELKEGHKGCALQMVFRSKVSC